MRRNTLDMRRLSIHDARKKGRCPMATGPVDRGDLTLSVLFPSEFVKADDLQGKQVTVMLASGNVDDVPMTGGRREKKLCFTIVGKRKRWIVGKTNGYALALLFAGPPKYNDLRCAFGKRVTLVADADTMKGQPCAALRILGSPDADAARTAMYARAWRGKRERGALCSRLKTALQLLSLGAAPPVEDVEEHEQAAHYEPVPADEFFGDDEAPAPAAAAEPAPAAAAEPTPAPAPHPTTTTKTKRTREPGEDG